ncbi:MAG: hypothetical protein ABSD71_07085 [Bacteroidales bacterium]|jgi:hypothetical protein
MRFLVVSLLALLAGILLLRKFRKEQLGKFFAFVAWFFIVVGFLLFIGFVAGGIVRMARGPAMGHPEFRHEMMMKGWHHGMWEGKCCGPEMKCMKHDSMMKSCCKHLVGDSAKKMPPPPSTPPPPPVKKK